MDFEEIKNPWSEYRLPDGRTIRVRHVLTSVMPDGVTTSGDANYNLNFVAIVHIDLPSQASSHGQNAVNAFHKRSDLQ